MPSSITGSSTSRQTIRRTLVTMATNLVKTFEYVEGARLKGEGRIEVTIQTNIGRTFVYRQESENGLFILPYATKNSPYSVKTTGPYRLVSSGMKIEVSEQDVMDGVTITG